jgi:hypothetical protein
MQYIVLMPEVHLAEVYIEADSEEEAKALVVDGDGDYSTSYYRRMIDDHAPLEVYNLDVDSAMWKDRERELIETSNGY